MNKKLKNSLACATAVASMVMLQPVVAEETRVEVHGFMTAAYQISDEESYYISEPNEAGINDQGSDHGSRMGFNITADFNDNTQAAMQLFAGASEAYETEMDWAFITYGVTDDLSIRFGKVKYAGLLYSDSVDIGAIHNWVEMPAYMYVESEASLSANYESFNGFSAMYETAMDDITLLAELYYGSMGEDDGIFRKKMLGLTLTANWDDKVTLKFNSNSVDMIADIEALDEELEVADVLVAGSGANAVSDAIYDEVAEAMEKHNKEHSITNIGLIVDWNDVLVTAEAVKVDMGTTESESKSHYVMLGYRMGKFTPVITMASLEKGNPTMVKESYTKLGVRYDLTSNINMKLEYTAIDVDTGTGLFQESPADDTVKMYGFSVDTTF